MSTFEIILPRSVRDQIGKAYVKALVHHARKEFARRKWPLTASNGVRLDKSFTYQIKGDKLEIQSTFPGIESFSTGFATHKDDEGGVVVHQGALQTASQWVHPGIARYNFIQQGLKAGHAERVRIIQAEIRRQVSGQ